MKTLYEKLRRMVRRNRGRIIGIGIVTTLLIAFLWPSSVVSVRPGEKGVLYSRLFGGTVLDRVYDEGVHVILPWDILYVYDVRILEETQDVDVLTVDGLTVNVQVSLRYQIMRERLPALHQEIGPDYRNKIVIPIMNSAVRQTIGNYRPDALYSTARQELQDQMLVDAIEEMGRIPILIHGFVVKSITLPEVLSKSIEEKLVAEQRYLRYHYLLLEAREEAKRKAVEGQGIRFYQSLVNENMTNNYLRFEGIKATNNLAASPNAKVVVVGSGRDGLPLILNTQDMEPQRQGDKATESVSRKASGRPAAKAPASAVNATNATGATTTVEGLVSGRGWKLPESEFVEFVKRLDATLLNPSHGQQPGQQPVHQSVQRTAQ